MYVRWLLCGSAFAALAKQFDAGTVDLLKQTAETIFQIKT